MEPVYLIRTSYKTSDGRRITDLILILKVSTVSGSQAARRTTSQSTRSDFVESEISATHNVGRFKTAVARKSPAYPAREALWCRFYVQYIGLFYSFISFGGLRIWKDKFNFEPRIIIQEFTPEVVTFSYSHIQFSATLSLGQLVERNGICRVISV